MRTTPDYPVTSERVDSKQTRDGVHRLYIGFVNVYLVRTGRRRWILVDTGLPHTSELILRRAAHLFGADRPPEAIILTHGHFDHSSNALALAREWRVPVFAHRLELPYLTGQSDYPPQDPTVGGALGVMSRAFPHSGIDLGQHVIELPEHGVVPGAREWRWIFTPGHTAGHISLFRERDRYLIAADALATVNQDSPLSMFNLRTVFSVPPAPFTTDWDAARDSVGRLADLEPYTVAAGHGRPVRGRNVALDLENFAEHFTPPEGGRYSDEPAVTDERGLISVPPPVRDTFTRNLVLGGMLVGAVALGANIALRRSSARDDSRDP